MTTAKQEHATRFLQVIRGLLTLEGRWFQHPLHLDEIIKRMKEEAFEHETKAILCMIEGSPYKPEGFVNDGVPGEKTEEALKNIFEATEA